MVDICAGGLTMFKCEAKRGDKSSGGGQEDKSHDKSSLHCLEDLTRRESMVSSKREFDLTLFL